MIKQVRAKIISNKQAAPGFFKIRLAAPSISGEAKAGQFVMVRCSGGHKILLRRPLAFHKIEKRSFELLYQVVGKGTKALSERGAGERLDIVGPLGNGFDAGNGKRIAGPAILVAGGIGVAPFPALAKKLARKGVPIKIFIGAKTKSHILCEKDFKKLGVQVFVATEDGSKGYRGMVTDLFRNKIRPVSALRNVIIYACGPRAMLKEAVTIAKSKKALCQVSLEEKMACGSGICRGCAVKTV
ncbi:MAG: dihydroorotate dehydrogenase electron transfer subunit, partial [Candidatus Omnitrophota bacterium]